MEVTSDGDQRRSIHRRAQRGVRGAEEELEAESWRPTAWWQELNQRLDVLTNPVEDLRKAEFLPLHRASDERVSFHGFNLEVETVPPEEYICGGESDAFVAVEEAVIVAE